MMVALLFVPLSFFFGIPWCSLWARRSHNQSVPHKNVIVAIELIYFT